MALDYKTALHLAVLVGISMPCRSIADGDQPRVGPEVSMRSGTPMATCRWSSGPRLATAARFALFVHHDDAAREFASDRNDKLAQFDKGWDEAVAKHWTVVSMKDVWKQVFAAASASGSDR